MQNTLTNKFGLNKSVLQLIAVLAMLIDHTAIFTSIPALYFIMHTISKIAIVIMCYFVAEGYHKTSNLGKYILRMAVFAAVAQIPFYLYMYWGSIPNNFNAVIVSMFRSRNVIFTLFTGLCLLTVLKSDYKLIVKVIAIIVALRLAKYSDWGYSAMLWIVGFGIFYGSKKKQMLWLAAVVCIRLGVNAIEPVKGIIETGELTYWTLYNWLTGFGSFAALLLLPLYNGEKGRMPKWTFYVFYPAHLLVLVAIIAILY